MNKKENKEENKEEILVYGVPLCEVEKELGKSISLSNDIEVRNIIDIIKAKK